MAVDPICKMDVDEESAKWVSEYKGKKYYFCAPGCKKEFDENPEKYTEEWKETLNKNTSTVTEGFCGIIGFSS